MVCVKVYLSVGYKLKCTDGNTDSAMKAVGTESYTDHWMPLEKQENTTIHTPIINETHRSTTEVPMTTQYHRSEPDYRRQRKDTGRNSGGRLTNKLWLWTQKQPSFRQHR